MQADRWQAWREWLAVQVESEETNPEDCIPYMECECPQRESEAY